MKRAVALLLVLALVLTGVGIAALAVLGSDDGSTPDDPRSAPTTTPAPGATDAPSPELARFYPTGADKAAIDAASRSTRLVCSDDDPYCPGRGAAQHWGGPLECEIDLLPGAGHLNVEAGYGPWPEMEAWALGEASTLRAAVPAPA